MNSMIQWFQCLEWFIQYIKIRRCSLFLKFAIGGKYLISYNYSCNILRNIPSSEELRLKPGTVLINVSFSWNLCSFYADWEPFHGILCLCTEHNFLFVWKLLRAYIMIYHLHVHHYCKNKKDAKTQTRSLNDLFLSFKFFPYPLQRKKCGAWIRT